MLTKLGDVAGVVQLVEQGSLPDGLPYIIAQAFGSPLAIKDSAELVISDGSCMHHTRIGMS